jgi:hypothetical protein
MKYLLEADKSVTDVTSVILELVQQELLASVPGNFPLEWGAGGISDVMGQHTDWKLWSGSHPIPRLP